MIDQLGYGRGAIPDGNGMCVGGQADVAHQIVQRLRSGRYRMTARRGSPRFERVALAATSFGGLIAPVAAYSFGDVDALIEVASAFDQGISPEALLDTTTTAMATCALGGEPRSPGEAGGYAYAFRGRHDLLLFDADPAVSDAFGALHERDPCGAVVSLAQTLVVNRVRLPTISVPVLLILGDRDAIFPPPSGRGELALYSGSSDRRLVTLRNAGHTPMLERRAPAFRRILSRWLTRHGF